MTQHIVSRAAEFSTTCCAYRVWRCAEGEEDPEQPETGSTLQKIKKTRIWIAYPYGLHLHMLQLYICFTSTYTKHMYKDHSVRRKI
ncbi:hypothetical protein EY178_00175 [Shigella sonnei]|nr:hypothetical protein [Shigella sonnei]